MSTPSTRVGDFIAWFRLTSGPPERVKPRLEYPTDHPWPNDAAVQVSLSVFEEDGQLFVGDVSVTTVPVKYSTPYGDVEPPAVGKRAVDTALWRALPLGALTQEAVTTVASDYSYAALLLPDTTLPRISEAVRELENARPKRGPKSQYTPQVLEVAARAFLAGGSKGVVAARDALRESGLLGRLVTYEQAKKAIAHARASGLIPPARR